MKALVLRKPLGIENLNFEDVPDPVPKDDEVLVKVLMSGLNPIDYGIINGRVIYNVTPMPHIPGAEAVGVVMENSETVDKFVSYMRGERKSQYTIKEYRSMAAMFLKFSHRKYLKMFICFCWIYTYESNGFEKASGN